MNITSLLLKHGIEGLINENENYFKQNIQQALAIKINESFAEIKENAAKHLLYDNQITEDTKELTEFLNFVNNFSSKTYKFKNGFNINITESDVSMLKNLFESLNPTNRQTMVSEIFNDGEVFKQYLKFAQKAQRLL